MIYILFLTLVLAAPVAPDTKYISIYKGDDVELRVIELHADGSYKCLLSATKENVDKVESTAPSQVALFIALCGHRLQ